MNFYHALLHFTIMPISFDNMFQERWSAYDICEGWAIKRGYITARSNRPDIHRAANHLLRMTLDGKITLSLFPPNYGNSQEFWNSHPDLSIIFKLLGCETTNPDDEDSNPDESISDSDEEDPDISESDSKPVITNKFNLLPHESDCE